MAFKKNWEKIDEQCKLTDGLIERMLKLAYPNKKYIAKNVISGGCANLNLKILFANDNQPILLRIYLRDKEAA